VPERPGEFTGIFGAAPAPPGAAPPQQPAARPAAPPGVPQRQPPDPGATGQVGTSTGVFAAPTPPSQPPAGPGEFTSVFGTPQAAAPSNAPPAWGSPPPQKPAARPASAPDDDYLARLSGTPREARDRRPAEPPPPPAPAPPPPAPGNWSLDLPSRPPPPPGPSEFTRIISAPQIPQLGLPGGALPGSHRHSRRCRRHRRNRPRLHPLPGHLRESGS
jgi:hypothetical protein